MTSRVRAVTFDELDARTAYDVWRLRQDVFVVEQASLFADLDGRDPDPSTRHIVLEEDGALVAYARLVDEADGSGAVRIGRVVVARGARGRGHADTLMRAALEAAGERLVRLDAQTGLAGWYSRLGFAVTGPEFDDAGIPHLPMERPATR